MTRGKPRNRTTPLSTPEELRQAAITMMTERNAALASAGQWESQAKRLQDEVDRLTRENAALKRLRDFDLRQIEALRRETND